MWVAWVAVVPERLIHLTCGQLGPPSTLSLATRLPDSQLEPNLGRNQAKLGQLGPNLGRFGVQLGSILGPTWAPVGFTVSPL